MEKSKVYFTDFRTVLGVSLPAKLQKLIRMAGIGTIDMDGKFVAIKMHFGELGNLAYLRPNYAKAVADVVKENGGLPFLTDCNTLYPGSRKHALEHLDCANINGFNTITTGCQIIIADGLRGTDDIEVPVPNGEYCKKAYIGRAVMDADIVISEDPFHKYPDPAWTRKYEPVIRLISQFINCPVKIGTVFSRDDPDSREFYDFRALFSQHSCES